MASIPYTSSDFKLVSAGFTDSTTITALFTYQPDAGLGGYTLTVDGVPVAILAQGPGLVGGQSVLTVAIQPPNRPAVLTVDSNLKSAGVSVTPGSYSFLTPPVSQTTPALPNDTAVDVLRKHLPASFQGSAWNALLNAIATGDQYVAATAAEAFDQAFLATADGKYLDQRAVGVNRPVGTGMLDNLYRALAVSVTTNKLTQDAILSALEIYYGYDSTRAYVDLQPVGAGAITEGSTLTLEFEGVKTVTVVFRDNDFFSPAQPALLEVATVITKALRGAGYPGVAVPTSTLVRVYSGAKGTRSSVKVHSTTMLNWNPSSYLKVRVDEHAPDTVSLQQSGGSITVSIPAYTQVVNRDSNTASYHDGTIFVYSELQPFSLTSITDTFTAYTLGPASVLDVGHIARFPVDKTFSIVLNYGWASQEGPIRVLGVSPTQLILDPTYRFTKVPQSNQVVVVQPQPFVDAGFILTGDTAGLAAAEQTLNDITAIGVDYILDVKYPDDTGLAGDGTSDPDIVRIYSYKGA